MSDEWSTLRNTFLPIRSGGGFSNPEPPGGVLFPSALTSKAKDDFSSEDGSTVAEQLFPPGKVSEWQQRMDKKMIPNQSFIGLFFTDFWNEREARSTV